MLANGSHRRQRLRRITLTKRRVVGVGQLACRAIELDLAQRRDRKVATAVLRGDDSPRGRSFYTDDHRRQHVGQHADRQQRSKNQRNDHESSRIAASSRASSSGVAETVGTPAAAGRFFFPFQLRSTATTATAPAPNATKGRTYPTRLNPCGRGAISARSP